MNLSPLVSIIIPTFNSANNIFSTIESVLNQDYSNFEIIIVDDFSSDGTEKIIFDHFKNESRIIYRKLPKNSGPAVARNTAISISSGELIAFLDSDDEWLPRKLKIQVELLSQFPNIDLLFTEVENFNHLTGEVTFYSKTNKIFTRGLSLIPVRNCESLYKLEGNIKNELYTGNFICISSVIVKKKFLNDINYFDSGRFGTEDLDLWIRLADKCNFFYLHKKLVRYNWMENSISRINIKRLNELINFHKTALNKPEYSSLLDIAYKNLYFTYKLLIIEYSKKWDPIMAWKIYAESRNYPIKKGLIYFAILSFFGHLPIFIKLKLINPISGLIRNE
jgi:glycosyltransferase involved in cell wall biosynthesis